jgi:PBSX family phage terminase large subunit
MVVAPARDALRVSYTPRGSAREIFSMRDPELVLSGPAGTGKSRALLEKVHLACLKHPNLRALMVRKTRRSLTESGMVTYTQKVLHPADGVLWRSSDQQYQYRNGAIFAVGGLDKPAKIMSSEWDMVYVQEALDLDEQDWEAITTRLRNGKNTYQQLLGDCNPGPPTHWIKQRADAGRMRMLESRHEDNPLLFDEQGNVTIEGARYLAILESLTGVRLARLRYGLWAAAEGTVYESSYDRAKNVIKRFPIPEAWPRWMSLDFGYTHPFVAKWYAEDEDGRYYCYREIYMTRRLVEEHAKQVKQLSRWGQPGGDPLPRAIYADHDAEGREVFTKYTGLYTTPAHKAVAEGIQAMAVRLRPAGDGKPRLMYFEDCLVERDQELANAKKPTCTIEEFDSYVWDMRVGQKKGDVPVKEFDHGMDSDRYLCAKDLQPGGVSYVKSPWR